MSWSAVIVGGAALVSGAMSSGASKKAGETQARAAGEASDVQLEMFYQNREDLAPWRSAGAQAIDQLWERIQAGPGEFTESPGYKFRLSEGEKAINRAAASRGMFDGGATMKALTRYGQDYASNEYDNFLNRWYQSLNPMASVAGVGQVATTDTARMGTSVAGDVGRNLQTAGAARASGYMGQAQAATDALDTGMSNYLMWRYLNPQSGGGFNTMRDYPAVSQTSRYA